MTIEYNDSVSRNQSDGWYQAINFIPRNLLLKEIAGLTEISGIVAKAMRNSAGYFACTILQIDTTETKISLEKLVKQTALNVKEFNLEVKTFSGQEPVRCLSALVNPVTP